MIMQGTIELSSLGCRSCRKRYPRHASHALLPPPAPCPAPRLADMAAPAGGSRPCTSLLSAHVCLAATHTTTCVCCCRPDGPRPDFQPCCFSPRSFPDTCALLATLRRPDGSRPEIYLKREDLNHTGAHKINNSLGQVGLPDGVEWPLSSLLG